MKLILISSIIFIFGIVGYLYKNKFIKQLSILKTLKNYLLYFKDNLVLFKNNLEEINFNYIITHKNKNAKYCLLKLNYRKKYVIDLKILQNNIFNKELFLIMEKYFAVQGGSEYIHEEKRLDEFLKTIEREIKHTEDDVKMKGDLIFKLMLAIGAVVSILLWWFMDVSILFKIAAIGILTIVISQVFQHQGKGDFATLSGLAGLVIVLMIVLGMISDLFGSVKNLFELY